MHYSWHSILQAWWCFCCIYLKVAETQVHLLIQVQWDHFLERRLKARLRKKRRFEVEALETVVSNHPGVVITDTGGIMHLAFLSQTISCPRLDLKWVDTQLAPHNPPPRRLRGAALESHGKAVISRPGEWDEKRRAGGAVYLPHVICVLSNRTHS